MYAILYTLHCLFILISFLFLLLSIYIHILHITNALRGSVTFAVFTRVKDRGKGEKCYFKD